MGMSAGQYHPVFPEVESWHDVRNAALGKVLCIQGRPQASETDVVSMLAPKLLGNILFRAQQLTPPWA